MNERTIDIDLEKEKLSGPGNWTEAVQRLAGKGPIRLLHFDDLAHGPDLSELATKCKLSVTVIDLDTRLLVPRPPQK